MIGVDRASYIKKLFPRFPNVPSLDCESCQFAKHHCSTLCPRANIQSASEVHVGQFGAGFVDGSVKLFDIRMPEMFVCSTRPHPKVERIVGVCFQPGLQPAKVVSASQAGDIQFLDMRNLKEPYLTIDAHRGSLTSLAVHRHAPLIASGSSKQLIKVFNLEGQQLGTIRYLSTFMAQKIGSVRCLTFHPYQVLLAAGATDACVSIYADEISPPT